MCWFSSSIELTLGGHFRCYWIFIWFYKADTASYTRCYCSISRINNRRFSSHNNLSAWIMYSLTSVHSHSTLSYTDTYRFGASLCYSTTSSLTGKTVRNFGWVRNSCYCIEVLPRDLYSLRQLSIKAWRHIHRKFTWYTTIRFNDEQGTFHWWPICVFPRKFVHVITTHLHTGVWIVWL